MTHALRTNKYAALALEPIHIGAERVRDHSGRSMRLAASTIRDIYGLPFIPASSLKGCIRSLCSADFGVQSCDGKGWNCPQPHRCSSCSIFGFANNHHGKGSSSLVRFSAADLLATPVRTSNGVVWLTSWLRLSRAGLLAGAQRDFGAWALAESLNEASLTALLNLLPGHNDQRKGFQRIDTGQWCDLAEAREIFSHIIVLDEQTLCALAEHSTNSTTSVSIDQQTGQARQGALFAVEYINRGSILNFDVTYADPMEKGVFEFSNTKNAARPGLEATTENVCKVIEDTLQKLRFFGIGGKRSRGYGRMAVWRVASSEEDAESKMTAQAVKPITRVMISYAHHDKHVARRLAADLQGEGLDVWLDEREILVGDSIHTKVEEGVTNCSFLIVLLSPASSNSAWVREEVNAVRVREKDSGKIILLPAILDGVDVSSLPGLLKDRRFAALAPYEEGFQDLLRSVRGHEERWRRGSSIVS